MSADFFKPECQQTTKAVNFGLCDDGPNGWAYLSEVETGKNWICRVENNSQLEVLFIAVDKCADVRRKNKDMERTCDCILTYDNGIVFVELKEKGGNWKVEGTDQIESTLNLFPEEVLRRFKHKRAFVANRRHPSFHVIDSARKQRFFSQYRVRLNIEATVKIE